MNIATLDISIIVVYLLIVLGVGYFLGRKEGADGFFVNNRSTKLWLLVFTALSTSVGAGTVIGVAGAAYDTGISFGLTFMLLSAIGWGVAGHLAPRIKKWADASGAYTLGDYFAYRYSPTTRRLVSIILVIVSFLWAAIQFIAFASLIGVVTNVNYTIALLVTAFLTILYTSFSGIKGDFYTDAIQFFVMLPVFVLLLIKGFALIEPGTFSQVPAELLNPYNYDGPIFFYAGIILGFPLIITAMEMWQRIFAAYDMKTAQRAFYLSGVLKVIVIGVAMILGFLAFHLLPTGVDNDSALFSLMTTLLPTGLLGLGLASILAILMSTVDSIIMVGSATITKDFYLLKNPEATDKQKLKVGRLAVLAVGLGGLGIAFFVPDIVKLSVVSAQIMVIFAPALIGGLVWAKPNAKAGFWSILLGFVITLLIVPFNQGIAFVPAVLFGLIAFIILSVKSKERFNLVK